jgi:hypothetical protein
MHDPSAAGEISEYQQSIIGIIPGKLNSKVNVHIYDARPLINAVGNKFSGKGWENSENYTNCELTFNNIENAPTMQSAFEKLGRCVNE